MNDFLTDEDHQMTMMAEVVAKAQSMLDKEAKVRTKQSKREIKMRSKQIKGHMKGEKKLLNRLRKRAFTGTGKQGDENMANMEEVGENAEGIREDSDGEFGAAEKKWTKEMEKTNRKVERAGGQAEGQVESRATMVEDAQEILQGVRQQAKAVDQKTDYQLDVADKDWKMDQIDLTHALTVDQKATSQEINMAKEDALDTYRSAMNDMIDTSKNEISVTEEKGKDVNSNIDQIVEELKNMQGETKEEVANTYAGVNRMYGDIEK